MALSVEQMTRLSGLLDEALPLDVPERRLWLDSLPLEHRDLSRILREALLPSIEANARMERLFSAPQLDLVESAGATGEFRSGSRLGPYELLRPLGAGGMAEVWLARRADGAFKRELALKLPMITRARRDLEPRFDRERDILASLHHPNIARMFDAGLTEGGQPYLALEYIDGRQINTFCDEQSLDLRNRLELFRQVLAALQYAHAHGVIHRDIKPSNILVSADGTVHLLDFGIAKLLADGEAKETELTQLSGRALTPDYAAPEQIAGRPITTAADVYSCGVVLYELLTGERPYRLKRNSRGALEDAILQTEPLAPSRATLAAQSARIGAMTAPKLARALRGDLDTIALKALKKEPGERYATANAFSEDITRFLVGDVVLARPDSVAYRALKFVRRHYIAIGVTAALILTLAGGLAATSYEAHLAARQRDAALQAQLRSLTQTAGGRLRDGDLGGAMAIILEVLSRQGTQAQFTPEALSVFQQARDSDRSVMRLIGHSSLVTSASFSADGKHIVTSSHDQTAILWDTQTGQPLRTFTGHSDKVNVAVFSPDGTRILTTSHDQTARIWDVATGRQLTVLAGHTDRVFAGNFSPDGRRIVTGSYDNTARIWDAQTGQVLQVLRGHSRPVHAAQFSPGGDRVVTGSYDNTARIWDVTSGRTVGLFDGHTDMVLSAAFSPDGRRVVTGSLDNTARVWEASTGRQLFALFGHRNWVAKAVFSSDGRLILTASYDRSAQLWNAETGEALQKFTGHDNAVLDARFSHDEKQVVTASMDNSARVWDIMSAHQRLSLAGAHGNLTDVRFSADGKRLIAPSYDHTAYVWDADSGRKLLALSGHEDIVNSAVFSPDETHILTSSNDKTVIVWDAETGQQKFRFKASSALVEDAEYSPDGNTIVTAATDGLANLWDASTGHAIRALSGHTGQVQSAEFSEDGKRILTAATDSTARIWDPASGRTIAVISDSRPLLNASFSPDGQRIMTEGHDPEVRIWDAATGKMQSTLRDHGEQLETAKFSHDGKRVVTTSDEGSVSVWDAIAGEQLLALSGPGSRAFAAEFSADDTQIASAWSDGIVRLWDARTPGIATQLSWAAAAQFDNLTPTDRYNLGLPTETGTRDWSSKASDCDRAAGAPDDPLRRAAGVSAEQAGTESALNACLRETQSNRNDARAVYQYGRALLASGDSHRAKTELEKAVALGYGIARVDLADALIQTSERGAEVDLARSLYEKAWKQGVTVAAFHLGKLHEGGVRVPGSGDRYVLAPDARLAQNWYEAGCVSGEPHALAYFGQQYAMAAGEAPSPELRRLNLLNAFTYYAAAAARARAEDWPDDDWRSWRYQRASVARLLDREGMMQEVARAYDAMRGRYSQPSTEHSECSLDLLKTSH
jgi:WD40 repeat protein/serine/threonine protein kinase/TPR repeat protein